MGCAGSREKGEETSKKIRKPKAWKHSEAITRAQLVQMREEFWDTAPHYGGREDASIICDYDDASLFFQRPKFVLVEDLNQRFGLHFGLQLRLI
ncbi:uncharacterized protein [Primulina eburnea]|uniref:uncharacterized protein isoform X2 n=1 Tax=Primulina eburnea TaxID=1245227 RepID=UPI003C6C6A18